MLQTVNKKLLYIVGGSLVVIIAGVVLILNRHAKPPVVVAPVTAVVRISEDGFEPATLTIKKGTVIVWKNDDTEAHGVGANPFPTHSELPTLDSKQNIAPGSDYSYSFDQSGTFHYHDETAPKNNGTIIVQ